MKIKPLGKIIILLLILGGSIGAYRAFSSGGGGGGLLSSLIPEAKTKESNVPLKANLPTVGDSSAPMSIDGLKMPSSTPADGSKPEIRMLVYAWNSQMGLMFANGGPKTTKGSLMADRDINLNLARQDDNGKLQENLVEFASEMSKGNAHPSKGANFVAIMGDGSATFLAGLNQQLKRLGGEYQAKIVGSSGYSRGEDKFMGPQEWKDNPRAAMGGVVAGVIRDGDWNIAQKWLGDNNLKNNPDEKTYDPDALNWVNASDYIDAGAKYITGYTEERDEVKNGKKTGHKKKIKIDAVVTWTPGDVNVAEKKGGIVPIVSTAEYSAQMPQVIIGIDKWCKENRQDVVALLDGMCRGGDAVKSDSGALNFAAGVSAKVYGEQDAAYWERYYKGLQEADATGKMMHLGGSSVNNLADNMLLFGLVPGSANTFAATYKVFGDIVKEQYPALVPSYPSVDEILDTSYLVDLSKKYPSAVASVANVKPKQITGNAGSAVSSRPYNIQFDTGKSSFTAQGKSTLSSLSQGLLIAGNTIIEVHGHTDNQGNAQSNMALSEKRAFAVKSWLEAKAPRNFAGRIKVFAHGQTEPVAENSTNEGRAKNRRVEIRLVRVGSN